MRYLTPKSNDTGICEYGTCLEDVPDGITIQLCTRHLRNAYAAHIIVEGLRNQHR